MAKGDLKMNLPKITVDDLFSTQETRDSEKLGKVINIKLKDIDDFEMIDRLKDKSGMEVPKSLSELKNKAKRFEGVINKAEMPELVKQVLKVK